MSDETIDDALHRQSARKRTDVFEVHIVSDIDGCLNIEDLPEKERWSTVSPAREAFAAPQARGIMVSLMSSRSLPEINLYRERADVCGFAIGEDGGAIQLPGSFTPETVTAIRRAGFRVTTLQGMNIVVLSRVGTAEIREVLLEVAAESNEPVISSLTSPPAELMRICGHESLAHAEASTVRAASAYAKRLSVKQAQLLQSKCDALGLRVMDCPWDFTHCIFGVMDSGEPVDKGHALRALNRIVAIARGHRGIRPIVIGNGVNDVPLMQIAIEELAGTAIAIPRPDGSFGLPLDALPDGTLRATKAAGAGIAEMLPLALTLTEQC